MKSDRNATVLGLVLGGASLFPNLRDEVRYFLIFATAIVILYLLFSQPDREPGLRAWITSLKALLIVHNRLVVAFILSAILLFAISEVDGFPYITAIRFVLGGIFTAALGAFIMVVTRRPSLRIVKGSKDPYYLVIDGIRRHIPNPETYVFLVLSTQHQVERISDLELNLCPKGNDLPVISDCELVKGADTEVYAIWEGKRMLFPDETTWRYFFPNRTPEQKSREELEHNELGGTLYPLRVTPA